MIEMSTSIVTFIHYIDSFFHFRENLALFQALHIYQVKKKK